MWTGVLGVTLVEGQDLPQYGQGDIYVRFRLGDQKYKSKVGQSLSYFPALFHSTFSVFRLFKVDSLRLTSPLLPPPAWKLHLSPSRCLSVTHLHLGSLGRGRSSSLNWARLPLTSPRASGAGLHCLHLHTQHALLIYLCSPAFPPLTILRRACLVLLCSFSVNLAAFLSRLFVCWTKLILIGSCQRLQSQSGYRGARVQARTNRDASPQHTPLPPLPLSFWLHRMKT